MLNLNIKTKIGVFLFLVSTVFSMQSLMQNPLLSTESLLHQNFASHEENLKNLKNLENLDKLDKFSLILAGETKQLDHLISELNKEKVELMTQIYEKMSEIELFLEKIKSTMSEERSTKRKLEGFRKKLTNYQEENKNEVKKPANDLTEENLQELREKLDQHRGELKNYQNQTNTLEGRKNKIKKSANELKINIEQLEEELKKEEKKALEALSEVIKLMKEIAASPEGISDIAKLNAEIRLLKAEIALANAKKNSTQQTAFRAASDTEAIEITAEQTVKEAKEKLEKIKDTLNIKDKEKKDLEERLNRENSKPGIEEAKLTVRRIKTIEERINPILHGCRNCPITIYDQINHVESKLIEEQSLIGKQDITIRITLLELDDIINGRKLLLKSDEQDNDEYIIKSIIKSERRKLENDKRTLEFQRELLNLEAIEIAAEQAIRSQQSRLTKCLTKCIGFFQRILSRR